MSNFEKLIQLGKRMGGTRGGEIHLEENIAYLTNNKRSSLYRFQFNDNLGTGSFYSSQAWVGCNEVIRRDDKVWFRWRENGVDRSEFVPNLDAVDKEMEEAFKKLYTDEKLTVPKSIFDVLIDKFLITKIKIKDNKIIATQVRSDGSVGFVNEIPLKHGLVSVVHEDTEEISIFTSDLLNLKPFIEDSVSFGFAKGKPISVLIPFSGGKCQALIGSLIYE